MLDLDAGIVGEDAGGTSHRRLAHDGARGELHVGESAECIHQCGVERGSLNRLEGRIDIIALQIANRDLAGEQPVERERRPGLDIPSVRIALQSSGIDLQVISARVGARFDERLDAGHQVVAGAHQDGVAVVVAIRVALRRPVGEHRVLIFGALRRAFHCDFDAIEALQDAERAAERGVDRKAHEPCLHVRAARIVGADDSQAFANQRGVARDIEPARHPAVEGRAVEFRRLAVGRVAAAQRRGDLMAHPVGSREQFGRNGDQRRGTPVERAPRVGVVAADDLNRGQYEECAGAQAELREGILLGRGAAAQQRRLLQGHLRGVDGVTGVTDRRAIRDAQQRIARRRGCVQGWQRWLVSPQAPAARFSMRSRTWSMMRTMRWFGTTSKTAPRASLATRSLR